MRFGTTIIDPPWPYQRTSASGKNGSLTGYSDQIYEPLSGDDLAALPVGDITAGVLFMWTTAPMIPLALKLVEAWGFEYITQMYWLKASYVRALPRDAYVLDGDVTGTAFRADPALGVGYWVRGNVEPIIIAKKPGTPSYRLGVRSTFVSRLAGHSRKPQVLHELVEGNASAPEDEASTLFSVDEKKPRPAALPGPYLELFARERRPGWTQLGIQLDSDGTDIRESLPQLLATETVAS